MTRILPAVAVVISLAAAQVSDVPRAVVEMRQALGGDALDAISAFAIGGTFTRQVSADRRISYATDFTCQFPDKCVRHLRQLGVPPGFDSTIHEGFSGDEPIQWREVNGRPGPPMVFPAQPDTPESIARRRASTASRFKQEFGRTQLVLFGAAPATFPVRLTSAGPDQLGGKPMDAIEVKLDSQFSARLLVDAGTHLPAALIWKAPARVVMATTQTVTTRRGEATGATPPAVDNPRGLPPGAVAVQGTPTADMMKSLPMVEHRLELSDYKTSNGVTWPRRIREMVDDQPYEEWRIESIKLNPKIDARLFDTSR